MIVLIVLSVVLFFLFIHSRVLLHRAWKREDEYSEMVITLIQTIERLTEELKRKDEDDEGEVWKHGKNE